MRKCLCLFILLSLAAIYACNDQKVVQEKVVSDADKCRFIDSLSAKDLELLWGVIIGVRSKGSKPSRFGVSVSDTSYHLPVYDEFKTREEIMNAEWYDVVKYAKEYNVDSTAAYDFVKTYSDKVIAVFMKTGCYGILQRPGLGDFIIFDLTSDEYGPA